jgi:hypothetical protein
MTRLLEKIKEGKGKTNHLSFQYDSFRITRQESVDKIVDKNL